MSVVESSWCPTRLESVLLERVSNGIIVTDLDARIIEMNPAAQQILGYTRDEVLGHSLTTLIRSKRVSSEEEHILDHVHSGEDWKGQSRFIRSGDRDAVHETVLVPLEFDGSNYAIAIILSRSAMEGNETAEITGPPIDETGLKGKISAEYLARISHELRTPLNAVIGFSDIIKNQLIGPVGIRAYLEYAQDIHDSALYMLELVNDLLDLSKMEAGQYELNYGPLVISACARDAVHLVEQDISRKQQILSTEIEPGLPKLFADGRAMKQMLLNLLSNAVKFTPRGGRIIIKAYRRQAGVIVSVEDNGIGVRLDDLETVLRPFGQIDNPITTDDQGTGLGVSIVKSLIELQGGHLEVESIPGVGTTVSLYFPPERVFCEQQKGAIEPTQTSR